MPAAESCHSRSLSWLVKSCIPADPARHIAVPVLCPTPQPPPPSSPPAPPISALPDDLLLECLARVPRASIPPLPAVSRRFATLLASDAFLHLRRAHAHLRPSLLGLSVSDNGCIAQALLRFESSVPVLEVAALPLPPTLLHCGGSVFAHARAVVLGRDVFLIGRGATLRVDALTGAARACRAHALPAEEVRRCRRGQPILRRRRVRGEPRRRGGGTGAPARAREACYTSPGASRCPARARRAFEAHVCAGSVDALHVASGAWARPRALPGGGCVVGACGVGDHLYMVASHAVELSFWRWCGANGRAGDGRGWGGWVALEAPPMPRGSVGLGMAVRVAMAGLGTNRVAAVVSAAAVRGHNAGGGALEGMVLVYDIAGGKWSRAPDLPPGFRRAACAGVEC
ncbi:hypothetical protein OsJ_35142 [Oryza sativa Japonica Group]|uniref:F-box domain-containing protein n=1 Tax=Oryza sativa subsp. japonica TaxID=39947 RepID=B9GBR9_ORYSJ|nr:hypothetical protein OsJ_35142 [Oryza sativa Japonica Group]